MSNDHQPDDLAHSVLAANLLDDPRWEKLALGTASPDEIESLRAWAQHSHTARQAWDLFRPGSEKEKAAMTLAVVNRIALGMPIVGTQNVRPGEPSAADVRAKPVNMRMMSRHTPREAPSSTCALAATNDRTRPYAGQPISTSAIASTARTRLFTEAPPAPLPRSRESTRVRPSLREALGTTSSVGVVCRDVVDTSSFVGAIPATHPQLSPGKPPRRSWSAQWFVAAAMALIVAVCFVGGWLVWHNEPSGVAQRRTPPHASSVQHASGAQPKQNVPTVAVPNQTATSESTTQDPAPPHVASSPASVAVSPRPSALIAPMKKPLLATSPQRPQRFKEVCEGVGVFQRCKKVHF